MTTFSNFIYICHKINIIVEKSLIYYTIQTCGGCCKIRGVWPFIEYIGGSTWLELAKGCIG
jgi:hypothetical protein